MREAVHERRGLYHGLELPIECYKHKRKFELGKSVTPHYHSYIEFIYTLEECELFAWVGGSAIELKAGEMLVISSNVPHDFIGRSKENRHVCIKALPSAICSSYNSFFDLKYLLPFSENSSVGYRYFSADELRDSEVSLLFEQAYSEWKGKEYGYELSVRDIVLRIFIWTIRRCLERGERVCEPETAYELQTMLLVQKAAEYISENYATATETQAASLVNMSYSHFSRIFKRTMGKSFQEYLMSVRINASERMLLDVSASITDVALACGFSSSSHFIDRFKQTKGVTPGQYRKIFTDERASESFMPTGGKK